MTRFAFILFLVASTMAAPAQTPPSQAEIAAYEGLFKAAHDGDVAEVQALVSTGADLNARDPKGRAPVHIAAFASNDDALRALAVAGADMNALDGQAYDVVTIAAVADDPALMSLAIELGNDQGRPLAFAELDGLGQLGPVFLLAAFHFREFGDQLRAWLMSQVGLHGHLLRFQP